MKGNNFEFFKDKNSNNLSIAILQDLEKHTKGKPPKNVLFKTGNKIKKSKFI